jgi:hypothetical protein
MSQCSATFEDAMVDSFVLGIRLVGYEAKHMEKRIPQILADPKVNAEITRALNKQMLELAREQTSGNGAGSGARSLSMSMRNDVLPAMGDKYAKVVQSTDVYKAAKKGLVDLGCVWKKTPVGAWVDENKMLLIIVAGGLALGGGVALYRARAGDVPADWATRLAVKALKFKILGDVEIGLDKLTFKPSEHAIALQAFTEFTAWKSVKTRFSANVATKEDTVVEFGGSMEVNAANFIGPLTGVVQAQIGAQRPPSELPAVNDLKLNWRLGLGVKTPKNNSGEGLSVELMAFVEEKGGSRKVGTAGKLTYDQQVGGQPMSLYATGSASQTHSAGKPTAGEVSFEAGFSWKF